MVAPFRNLSNKMGGVSIISGTLTSASGAFPTFVTLFIILLLFFNPFQKADAVSGRWMTMKYL